MISLNRLAAPADFTPNGGCIATVHHPFVSEHTLQGQAPQRDWEYSLALRALEHGGWDFNESRKLLFADIGGAGSNFWRTLKDYTSKPIYRIDPNHSWQTNPEDAALYFRQTLREFLQDPGDPTGVAGPAFDAVFCLSVIEHVPARDLQQFERDLVSLLKPGGLLVLTTDVGEKHPDEYHFHWMRERIYTPGGLAALAVVLAQTYHLRPLTPPDFTWHGPTVYNYTFGMLACVKE